MKTLVLDASVVMSLYLPEEHSGAAERHVGKARNLLAPDLIWPETANVIWKRRRRGELSLDESMAVLEQIQRLPLRITPSADLLADAFELATRFDRTVYDCLYLALAVRAEAVLLTADRRLVNAMASTPLNGFMTWVGEG